MTAWLLHPLHAQDAVVVGFGLLRIITVVVGTYLVVVSALGALARTSGIPCIVRSTDVVTLPSLRRWLDALVGTTLLIGAVNPTWAVAAPDPSPAPPVMSVLPDQPPAPVTVAAPATTTTSAATWTIQPGQHLWLIAQRTLEASAGRPVSAAEIVPYWRRLIDANRARLRHPDNPSLVYPGQIIELPER